MPTKLQTIINWIEQFAPKNLAEEWDNVGLQIGHPSSDIETVMLTLDVSLEVVEEAIANKVDLIVSHHPLIFRPLKNIRYDNPLGKTISSLIENKISLYSAHTNLDSVKGGINCVLAQGLGLTDIEILNPTYEEKLCKIVIFVPVGYQDQVRAAMSKAGAGWIGNYSDCTFQIKGTGTFKPLKGADPFIGEVGELEEVEEIRLETILPQKIVNRVVKAMIKAHPYEEVAYDLVPLLNEGNKAGLGRVGCLPEPITFAELTNKVKTLLGTENLKVGGNLESMVRKIALCGGAGASLLNKAAFKGVDIFVTGDIKYHEAQDMLALGLGFIDAGHYATENLILPVLGKHLVNQREQAKVDLSIIFSTVNTNPFTYV